MARRWHDPNAFRVDPAAAPAARPSRHQSVALIAVLALVAGLLAAVSYLVRPERARAFDLFSGSLFLDDTVAPVAVDLATGSPSIRLIDATAQIGATPQQSTDLAVVPLAPGGGTLLLNRSSGEFNMVDPTGFVIKRDGGVPLPKAPQSAGSTGSTGSTATGLPAESPVAPDLAYIEQASNSATRVYLVSQSTVREAIGAHRVKPRASASIAAAASTGAGGQASADGDLWLLVGARAHRTVTQLALPHNSAANGARLRQSTHGTVRGPAALGSAAFSSRGPRAAIAVATSGRMTVFGPGGSTRTVQYTPPGKVDTVLATSNQVGRFSFLLHGSAGWSLVSVRVDGTGLRGPTPLVNVASTADLIPPAASADNLYTMDRGSGQLLQINSDGIAAPVPGAATYPRILGANGQPLEPGGWADAYVIARGARVFYDSPSHREALAVFTDGTRAPLVVQKSAAVGVNAVADAAALTRSRNQPSHPTNQGPTSKPPPRGPSGRGPAPIDNNIDCRTTTQKPNIPQIYGVQAGSRSVTFSWLYPRLNNQDCIPRTYVVTASLLSGDAPPAPGSVTVQDQQGVTLTGLYPDSTYSITVTAYLGAFSTPSAPVRIQTSPQGPDAPTDVRVHADANGNWVLSWDSCGGVAQHCVPSWSWQIEPRVCDGRGFVGTLPPLSVPADPTTRAQPPAVYHGSTALLGRGLSFQIMGRGVDNLPGTFSAATPCVYSWAPPIPSAMQLTASTPTQIAFGATTTANVTLNLGIDPVRDIGGVGAQVTFTLTGNGATQTNGPIAVDGSHSTVSTTFTGITAGASYQATASVQPAHGGAPVVLNAPQLSTRSAWPNYSVTANCAQAYLACTLQVQFSGISSGNSHGEQFSLTNDSQVRCNNAAQSLKKNGFDPATSPITVTLLQKQGYYGTCTVSVGLIENAPQAAQLVYGGIPSPLQTVSVDLGPPAQANISPRDLDVSWSQQGGSAASIYYTGSQNLADLTDNWSYTITAPNNVQQCGSASGQPGSGPGSAVLVNVDPTCVNLYGGLSADWTVTVDYYNSINNTEGGPFSYPVPGPVPGYQPCSPQGPAAAWGATQADGISVTMDPSSNISGCSQWQYALYDSSTSPPSQVCSVATDPLVGPPPKTIETTLCGTPPSATWFVRVSWLDTAGQPQHQDIPLGTPPPS